VTRIYAGVEDLVPRIRDGQINIGYSVVGRSGGRVMLYAVCTMHKETRNVSFLIWLQNQDRRFPSLGLKTGNSGLVTYASK
jgi:hypothetical protein